MIWTKIASIMGCILLIFMCIGPAAAKIEFNYKCDGKGATISTYSYLKEPRIEENGFERGLKSGSFNYLENGKVHLEEKLSYYYGNGTNKSNSTVKHSLNVEFSGDRGISEFFGRGFFGDNRYLSAWKKIRYEESPNVKKNGEDWINRSSNYINVKASVSMKTLNGTDYNFKYHADVGNGVIEAKDDAGWTNRTGPRRTDWEYHSLSSGDQLNITNDLMDSGPHGVEAGPIGEWLPCCFSGTVPMIEQNNTGWPTRRVIATIEANRIWPTKNLSTAYPVSSGDSPTYWKREIQIGLSSRPSVPLQNAEGLAIGLRNPSWPMQSGIVALKPNQLLPTMHLSTAYAGPSSNYPIYLNRGAQIGLRSLMPSAVVPLRATANGSSSMPLQEISNSSLFASVPVQNPANCIGDNCPANFFVSKNQSDLTCNKRECDGYECIYTYDNEPTSFGTASSGAIIPEGSIRDIDVTLDVFEADSSANHRFKNNAKEENATYEIYKITTTNTGDVRLDKVILSAVLAKGMEFINTSYLEAGRGKPDVNVDPESFDKNTETNVRWNLGSLAPEEIKSVIMAVYLQDGVQNSDVSVTVTATSIDGTDVTDTQSSADVIERCGWFIEDKNGYLSPCKEATAEFTAGCKEICPNWIKSFGGSST